MPYKCSVPCCKSNYESAGNKKHVSVFSFPESEELRALWLKRIPRKDWIVKKSARVCEFHFDPKFISKIEEFIDKDGNRKTFPRKRALLMPNAVPTIFEGLPKYLSSRTEPERTDPAKRKKLIVKQHEQAVNNFLSKDVISNFDDFIKEYSNYVNDLRWKFEVGQYEVIAYIIDFVEIPKLSVSIKVDYNMNLTIVKNGFIVTTSNFDSLLPVINGNIKLQRWSQFENLLSRYAVDL